MAGGFIVENFGGIAPKIDARRLSDSVAQTARNCLLTAGALEPLPGMASTAFSTVSASASSLYYYNNTTWLAYTDDRNFAKVPIQNDALARIVITNPTTYPVIYSAGTSYRLGIPAPASPPSAVAATPPEDPNGVDAETVSYVVTLVDVWGAEGPPSAPSASINRVRDTAVTVTLPAAPAGAYNFGSGALKRIYRSNTGSAGGSYQYAGEVAIAALSFADSVANGDLGELLPSATWIGPADDDSALYPDGPMLGVVALPNGVLAGFSGKTVMFSEPYLYHAWPVDYRIAFEDTIVGIAPGIAGLVVTTVKGAHVIAGASPASMTVLPAGLNQGCVSKRGLVDMGGYAIYPSPDGLVLVEGTKATLVTADIFTREQWQAYTPSTIRAFEYEGRYIAFYNNGTPAGFIFDPQGGINAFVNISENLEAAYYDSLSDTLYVSDAGTIKKWGQNFDSTYTYTWKSKKHLSPYPMSYSIVRVQAWEDLLGSPVVAKVYADGVLVLTATLADPVHPYSRIPAGFKAREWELELTGTNPISHAGIYPTLADSI